MKHFYFKRVKTNLQDFRASVHCEVCNEYYCEKCHVDVKGPARLHVKANHTIVTRVDFGEASEEHSKKRDHRAVAHDADEPAAKRIKTEIALSPVRTSSPLMSHPHPIPPQVNTLSK